MADDLGWTDLACFGSKYYETPNIDKLAEQGMKLTRHHHCQNCQPTRAALMSGQYGARTGVYTVGGIDRFDWSTRPLRPADNVTELPLEKTTVAQVLKKAGYATGMFGKWHLGEKGDYHPGKRGFDEAIVSHGQALRFRHQPEDRVSQGEYLADFLTDKAVDFITAAQGRAVLPLPAALWRSLASSGQAGAHREVQAKARCGWSHQPRLCGHDRQRR
jgi:arylsulfatase A-like enzyme